jgi:hypothetical protein
MKPFRLLIIALLLLPLTVGAETITWTGPTQFTDGTPIPAGTSLTYYLRGGKENNAARTYFGETRGNITTWVDNVMVKMNQWATTGSVAGWVAIVPGDNVVVTLSAAYVASDGKEYDGPQTPPYRWTIPKVVVPSPVTPSCKPPTGILIK